MDGKQTVENNLPAYRAERQPLGLPLAAALLATAALSGCNANASGESEISDQVSPTDAISQTIHDVSVANKTLSSIDADIATARRVTFKLEEGSIVRQNLERAIELTAAEEIIDGVMSLTKPTQPEEAKLQAQDIPDPVIREELLGQIDALSANQIVDAIRHTYEPMPEADALDRLSRLPDTPERRAAVVILHAEKAKDILDRVNNDYVDAPLSSVQARLEIETISDPEVKNAALQAVDMKIAGTILDDISSYRATLAEAVNRARTEISNPSYQNDVVAAAGYYDQYENQNDFDKYNDFSEINYKYSSTYGGDTPLQTLIDHSEDLIREIDDSGRALSNRLDEQAQDSLQSAQEALADYISDHHGVVIGVDPIDVPSLENPTAPIDLTEVNGSKLVTDWFAELNDDEEDGVLEQFAEVYAEDGEMKLHFQEKSGLKKKDKELIAEAVSRANPLIVAAMASGKLLSMRFVKSDDYEPYYFAASREVVMVLPSDDSTSVDQLSSGINHETIHALTRDIDIAGIGIAKEQVIGIDLACAQLRSVTYDALEAELTYIPEVLAEIRAIAKPEDVTIFDQFIKEATEGTLDSMMADYMKSDLYTHENNCYDVNLADVINTIGFQFGIEDAADKLKYLQDTPEMQALASHWYDIQEYRSVYKELNESNFIESEYEYTDTIGHSQDNTDELVTSIVNVAISYPDKFKTLLNDMNDKDRAATISALTVSLDIIRSQHPSLVAYLDKVQVDAVAGESRPKLAQ